PHSNGRMSAAAGCGHWPREQSVGQTVQLCFLCYSCTAVSCQSRMVNATGAEIPASRGPRPLTNGANLPARNLITDVAGILVGQAHDPRLASGVTAVLFDPPAVAAVDVRGGAPGTRETDLLEPHRTMERIDAVVLSGGSAFGLDAATGVQACLREQGR